MMRVLTATVLSALLTTGTSAVVMAQTPAAPAPRPAAPAAPAPRPAAPAAPAAPVAQAPTPALPVALPFPADARIGFIDMQAVVSQSKLGKSGQDKMKVLTDKKTVELQAKNKQIQTLQQEVQAGASVLSATVLNQKNRDIENLTREVQFMQEQAQVDVDALQKELLDEFTAKVLPIVEEVRKERNLWVVFALGDGTGVAAVHAGLDLSAEVVKRLDVAK